MKRCFGYIRVSTVKQGDGVSLDAQKDAIIGFAERNGITITRWFEEKETAAKRGRPVFAGMIRALMRKQADGVVIHKIDRSARNIADWAKIGELSDAGIDVHFAAESLDFRTRGGRLSADIQAVIAADYIRNLQEETIKGITGRLKQGLYPFGAPLGYLDNGGGKPKTPDPERAPLIVKLFELYASGQYSLNTLPIEMQRRGLRNKYGKPVTKGGVEAILSNPFYCGIMRIKTTGAVYEGIHEPIISPGLFDTVQEVRAGKSGKKVTKHNHLFRGLFRCQLCMAAMTPERQKGHVYYRCHTRECVTKCIAENVIEQSFRSTVGRIQLTKADEQKILADLKSWIEKRSPKRDDRHFALQLGNLEARLDRLTDAHVDGLIDAGTYNGRKQRLLLEKAQITKEREAYQKHAHNTGQVRTFLERIKQLKTLYESLIPAEKREFIAWATSNRSVAGRNVCVQPSQWLLDTEKAVGVLGGAQRHPASRSRHDVTNRKTKVSKSGKRMREQHLSKLVEIAGQQCKEFERYLHTEPDDSAKSVPHWKHTLKHQKPHKYPD